MNGSSHLDDGSAGSSGEPTEELQFFEFGAFESPLQRAERHFSSRAEGEEAVELLRRARTLAHSPGAEASREGAESAAAASTRLRAEREWARRECELDPATIEELASLAAQVGEDSYVEQYALAELVQAAAVARCNLMARNLRSVELGIASRELGRTERARAMYRDALEGLQIMGRFFQTDEAVLRRAENSVREGWAKTGEPTSPFDTVATDRVGEWLELIRWNSDLGSGQGLLAQADATLRLAIGLEQWDSGRPERLEPLVEEMQSRIVADAGEGDEFYASRCLVTLGDALMEVGRWQAGARVHEAVGSVLGEEMHPVYVHSVVQAALARLMDDDRSAAGELLERIDGQALDGMAELVLTFAAEAARFHSVSRLCAGEERARVERAATAERVSGLMKTVALIVSGDVVDRVGYLRNLFFSVLARDVESMLSD